MFDGYHKWLGIPGGQRPPTHYQLLGIMPDEQDPDVIESAAIRQTAYVRNFQTSPHALECARILNELAQARVTLLNPTKRASYDAHLALSNMARPVATHALPDPAALAVAPEFILPGIVDRPSDDFRSTQRRETGGAPSVRLMGGLGLAALTLAAIAILGYKSMTKPTALPGPAPSPAAFLGSAPARPTPTKNVLKASGEPVAVARPNSPAPALPRGKAIFEIVLEPPGSSLGIIAPKNMIPRNTVKGPLHRVEFASVDGAGLFRIEGELEGYKPFRKEIRPKPGDRERMVITLSPEADSAPSSSIAAGPDDRRFVVEDKPSAPVGVPTDRERPTVVVSAEERRFKGHVGPVRGVAFAPDGLRIATAGADRTVRLWVAASGEEIRKFDWIKGEAAGVAFSPDAKHVIACGADKFVRMWNAENGREIHKFTSKLVTKFNHVAVSPDSRFVLAAGFENIFIWDARTGRPFKLITRPRQSFGQFAIAPDSSKILVAAGDKAVLLYDLRTFGELDSQVWREPVLSVAISPLGLRSAAGGGDGWLDVRDLGGASSNRLVGHKGNVNALAFMRDGRLLSGGDDGAIRLWDVSPSSQREVYRFEGHSAPITGLAAAPDSRTFVSSGLDGSVRVWKLP